MGIISASETIKNARLQAGLSQSKLAEGICSTIALSNFETGKYGISPSNFSLLMSKLGRPCEEYPLFESMNDYECSKHLEDAKSYIYYCKAELALDELIQLEQKRFNRNKFYYQRWLSMYSYILIMDDLRDGDEIIDLLTKTVALTQPDFDINKLSPESYNYIEVSLILFIALFSITKKENSLLCAQVLEKMKKVCTKITDNHLLYLFIQCVYHLKAHDYSSVLPEAKKLKQLSLENNINTFLVTSVFFTGIALFKLDDPSASEHMHAAFLTADKYYPFLSCYFRKVFERTRFPYNCGSIADSEEDISFKLLSLELPKDLTDGSFDIYGDDVVTIGTIIETLRKKQKLSQQILCNGLCNKSTLSKIEKNLLNPDILVAQAILERLGLSSKEFVFFGNQVETEFYNIKIQLTGNYKLSKEEYKLYVDRLGELSKESPLIEQHYYLFKTQTIQDKEKIMELCKKGIKITLPDFTMRDITNYRLSWAEMTLVTIWINTLAFTENHYDAPYYYQQLYQYSTDSDFELLWKKNHLATLLIKYDRYLGENKMYQILLARVEQWDFDCCNFYLDNMLNYNYYLFRAYSSFNNTEKAKEYYDLTASMTIILDKPDDLAKLRNITI